MTDEPDQILLRCAACGRTKTVARQSEDPVRAIVCETNECDQCQAAQGGFGSTTYYDKDANELGMEEVAAWLYPERKS